MPINAEIPLQVKPAVAPDFMQSYGNALAIKSHIQQQQLQQKQMQTLDLENQERQMKMTSLKEYNDALKDAMVYPSGNPPSAPSAARGPSAPSAAPGSPAPAAGFTNASGQFVQNPNAMAPRAAPGTPGPAVPASDPDADTPLPDAVPDRTPFIGDGPAPNSNALAKSPGSVTASPAPASAPQTVQPGGSPTSATAPQAGYPTIDFNKLYGRLAQRGQGSQVMGLQSAQAKFQQALALQHKTEAEAHGEQLSQVAQAFQRVNGAPADQKDAVYQQALKLAVPLAQKYGMDTSQWAARYDPATTPTFVDGLITGATSLQNFATQTREAADLAHRVSTGIPDTAKKIGDAYDSDVSQAHNQNDLDEKNKKWDAIYNADPTGATAKLFAAVRQTTWKPEISQDATIAALKPDERIKFFTGQMNDAAQRLKSAALRGQKAYESELARQVTKNPDLANLFPGADGDKWDAKAVATQAASVGATGEQYVTAQNATEYRQQLVDIRERLADISQQRADQSHETGAQHKQYIMGLATQANEESGANGGRGIDDTIANVGNTAYYQGHPIGDNRLEVVQALRSMQSQTLINQNRQDTSDKKNQPGFVEIGTYAAKHPGADGKAMPLADAKAAILAARKGGSPANQRATPSKPVAAKPPTVKPAAISEADARKRAAAAGTDGDWYVAQLKQRGLLQ